MHLTVYVGWKKEKQKIYFYLCPFIHKKLKIENYSPFHFSGRCVENSRITSPELSGGVNMMYFDF